MAEFEVKAEPGVGVQGSQLTIDTRDPFENGKTLRRLHFNWNSCPTLYCWEKVFYWWNESYWQVQSDQSVRTELYKFLSRCKERVELKGAKGGESVLLDVRPNKTMVEHHLDALRSACAIPVDNPSPPFWLDGRVRPNMFALRNGLYEVDTGKMRPHTPLYFNLGAADYEWDEEAECPEWLRFLGSTADAETVAQVREWFEYILSGEVDQQKAFLMVGPPRSGRGTIARMLTRLLGEGNVTATSFGSLGELFGIEDFVGRGLAIIGDSRARTGSLRPEVEAKALERVLRITGRDMIDVPRKGTVQWRGTLGTRLLVLANSLPKIADSGGAFAGRFEVAQFLISWEGREDTRLEDRLGPESAGAFNWVLGARAGRLARGGRFARSGSDVAMRFRNLNSTVGLFVSSRVDREGRVEPERIYEVWTDWCRDKGCEPGTEEQFGAALRAAIPSLRKVRPRIEGEPTYFYEGASLR